MHPIPRNIWGMEKKGGERERNLDRLKKAEWLEKNGGPRQRNAETERFEKSLAESIARQRPSYACPFPGCLKEFVREAAIRTHVATHERGECPYILVREKAPQFEHPK